VEVLVGHNGQWLEVDSAILVRFVQNWRHFPADSRLMEAIKVSTDQAALTGESLPQSKKVGDECFS